MAKSLLLGLLLDTLGMYVEEESLTASENIKVGVFTGKIELRNLRIKKQAFQSITGIPVFIDRGIVSLINVDVPWTSLGSAPVKVTVDGIYIQASPMDATITPRDVLMAMEREVKASLLKAAEDAAYALGSIQSSGSDAKESTSSGFFQRLAVKIIDNLEVSLSSLHVCYVDSISSCPTVSRCGLLIRSLRLQTTDSTWEPQYISRDENTFNIHKLGLLDDVGMYWDPAFTTSTIELSWEEWISEMKTFFSTQSSDNIHYQILEFSNALKLQLIVNDKHNEIVPKVNIKVSSKGFNFSLTKVQFDQMNASIQTLSDFDRIRDIRLKRPEESPLTNPKLWWQYARWRILGCRDSIAAQFNSIVSAQKYKGVYVKAVKEMRLSADKKAPVYTANQQICNEIESMLPLPTLAYFRRFAMKDFINEEQMMAAQKKQITQSTTSSRKPELKGSYYGFFKRGFKSKDAKVDKASVALSDDIDLDALQSQLDDVLDEKIDYIAQFELIELNVKVRLFDIGLHPLASVDMSLSADFHLNSSLTQLRFSIDKLSVLDDTSHASPYPFIVCGLSEKNPVNLTFKATLDSHKTTMRIDSEPLRFNWNASCVKGLLQYVSLPFGNNWIPMLHPPVQIRSREDDSLKLSTGMELIVDVRAPIFVFPLPDDRSVIFDMGRLSLHAAISGASFTCLTSISQVRSGISQSLDNILDIEVESSKLIQSFDVTVRIVDTTFPLLINSVVEISTTELLMALDYAKISSLLNTYELIVRCLPTTSSSVTVTAAISSLAAVASRGYSVSIDIAAVTAELVYDMTTRSKMSLSSGPLKCYSNAVIFNLSLLSLFLHDYEDPLRTMTIIEGTGDNVEDFISIKYQFTASSCDVHIGSIEVGASEFAIIHMTPFLSDTNQLLLSTFLGGIAVKLPDTAITVPTSTIRINRIALSLHGSTLDSPMECRYLFAGFGFNASIIGNNIDLSILSCSVSDERQVSKSHLIRTLVTSSEMSVLRSIRFPYVLTLKIENDVSSSVIDLKLFGVDVFINAEVLEDLGSLLSSISAAATVLSKTLILDKENKGETPYSTLSSVSKPHLLQVELVSPRLMMIRDPEHIDTTAVGITAHIQLKYGYTSSSADSNCEFSYDTADEAVDISLNSVESYLYVDASNPVKSLQIIYPFSFSAVLRRSFANNLCISAEGEASLDEISIQVTITELFVAIDTILKCVTLSRALLPLKDCSVVQESIKKMPAKTLTSYNFELESFSAEFVILNDSLGQVHPLLKASIQTSNSTLSGSSVRLRGNGQILLAIDFYNDRLLHWEPLLEKTTVAVELIAEDDDETSLTSLNLVIDEVQINISSLNLKTINDVTSRVSGSTLNTVMNIQHFYIQNELGESVDVYDSVSGTFLIHLPDGNPVEMPLIPQDSRRSTHPMYLSIVLTSRSSEAVAKNISISSAKADSRYKVIEKMLEKPKFTDVQQQVIEEIYENQRYSLNLMSWGKPSMINDPAEWTDINGHAVGGIKSFPLPAGWEWTSAWELCFEGGVTDAQGFYYEGNFMNYSTSKQRNRQTLDVVRRRKWKRTRRTAFGIQLMDYTDYVYSSLEYTSRGEQVFKLCSGVQIFNATNIDLEVWLSKFDDPNALQILVYANSSQSVSLRFGEPNSVRFRIGNIGWSYVFNISSGHSSHEVELLDNKKSIYLRMYMLHKDSHLEIKCLPPYTIENLIPFDLTCSVLCPAVQEYNDICRAGSSIDIHCIGGRSSFELRFSVQNNKSSAPISKIESGKVFELIAGDRSSDVIVVCMLVTLSPNGGQIITLYSKAVILNYCELSLQVRTKNNVVNIENSCRYDNPSYINTDSSVWASGESGVRFINMVDTDNFMIGLDSVWSEPLTLSSLSTTKSPFEISHQEIKLQLAYSVTRMERFSRTEIISIMPKFRILNTLSESLFCRQVNDSSTIEIRSEKFCAWSPLVSGKLTSVYLKTSGSEWSFGSIDLNAIGSYDIVLPVSSGHPIIVHIEILLAPQSDLSCYISVVIWKPSLSNKGGCTFIENNSDIPLSVMQSHDSLSANETVLKKCGVVVNGGEIVPIGWINISLGSLLKVSPVGSFFGQPALSAVVNMVDIGYKVCLEDTKLNINIQLLVVNTSEGKVLRVTAMEKTSAIDALSSLHCRFLTIRTKSLGVSLIAEAAERREILFCFFSGIDFEYSLKGLVVTYVFRVRDLQIDNFIESNAYPVLFMRDPNNAIAVALPIIELFVETDEVSSQTVYRTILSRLLVVRVYLDASALQIFLVDFLEDSEPTVGITKNLDGPELNDWVENYRLQIFDDSNCGTYTEEDKDRVFMEAKRGKIYIENLVIHPIKLIVNLTTSPLSRTLKSSGSLLSVITAVGALTAVHDMEIRLNAFIACNLLESPDALFNIIITKINRDIQGQLLHIAGSYFGKLDAIGRPADLFTHIGGGVSDFFYEPYQGLMKSPKDFAKGLGKGTKSLISGLVTGTVASTMTILENAALGGSKSVAFIGELTGDSELIAKRKQHHLNSANPSSKGVLGGLITGSSSVVSGISSGITGLVTKPIEGGRTGGALGFFKGLGHGVIGAAVNPLVGVGDGIAAVAHGLSTQVSKEEKFDQIRGARNFKKINSRAGQVTGLLLLPLDKDLLLVDDIVKKRARNLGVHDFTISTVQLSLQERVIISSLFISLHIPAPVASFAFSSLSHFKRIQGSIIEFYNFSSEPQTLFMTGRIDCKSDDKAEELVEALLKESSRMKNPSAIQDYDVDSKSLNR